MLVNGCIYPTSLYRGTVTCVEGGNAGSYSEGKSGCDVAFPVFSRFGISGARAHARTKLVDLRARVYATHLKGFLTRDPLGHIDSHGLWNYVAGDPVNFRDPSGMDKENAIETVNMDAAQIKVTLPHKSVNPPTSPNTPLGTDSSAAAIGAIEELADSAKEQLKEIVKTGAITVVFGPVGVLAQPGIALVESVRENGVEETLKQFNPFKAAADKANAFGNAEDDKEAGKAAAGFVLEAIKLVASTASGSLLSKAKLERTASGGRPRINPQKQAGHVPGTPQKINRIKQGKPTSSFFGEKSGERLTRIANEKGTPVPGRPGVKEHDFGFSVGTGPSGGMQSRVRVHQSPKTGNIHGHPSGPERF